MFTRGVAHHLTGDEYVYKVVVHHFTGGWIRLPGGSTSFYKGGGYVYRG